MKKKTKKKTSTISVLTIISRRFRSNSDLRVDNCPLGHRYRVLKCDVIKMKFLKLWDLSGYRDNLPRDAHFW